LKKRIPETTFELVTNKQQNKKADSPGTIPVSKNKYSELFTLDNNGPTNASIPKTTDNTTSQ